jgi:hypothetical protein
MFEVVATNSTELSAELASEAAGLGGSNVGGSNVGGSNVGASNTASSSVGERDLGAIFLRGDSEGAGQVSASGALDAILAVVDEMQKQNSSGQIPQSTALQSSTLNFEVSEGIQNTNRQ